MEKSIYYQFGFEFGISDYNQFKEKFGEPKGGSHEWMDYLLGISHKNKIDNDIKYGELNLDIFESELAHLCNKYNITMNFGCGCCGAGLYCGDFEFNLKNEL